MKQAFLLSSVLLATCVFAADNEKKVQFKDLPPSVQKSAQEQSKGTIVRGYAREMENGKTYYEVETRVAGKNRDVLLDEAGSVVEVEQQMDPAEVPSSVMAGLQKEAAYGKILSVESVHRGGKVSYEADVVSHGKQKEIAVDTEGQPIKPE